MSISWMSRSPAARSARRTQRGGALQQERLSLSYLLCTALKPSSHWSIPVLNSLTAVRIRHFLFSKPNLLEGTFLARQLGTNTQVLYLRKGLSSDSIVATYQFVSSSLMASLWERFISGTFVIRATGAFHQSPVVWSSMVHRRAAFWRSLLSDYLSTISPSFVIWVSTTFSFPFLRAEWYDVSWF